MPVESAEPPVSEGEEDVVSPGVGCPVGDPASVAPASAVPPSDGDAPAWSVGESVGRSVSGPCSFSMTARICCS